jgi:hypothetical protein
MLARALSWDETAQAAPRCDAIARTLGEAPILAAEIPIVSFPRLGWRRKESATVADCGVSTVKEDLPGYGNRQDLEAR